MKFYIWSILWLHPVNFVSSTQRIAMGVIAAKYLISTLHLYTHMKNGALGCLRRSRCSARPIIAHNTARHSLSTECTYTQVSADKTFSHRGGGHETRPPSMQLCGFDKSVAVYVTHCQMPRGRCGANFSHGNKSPLCNSHKKLMPPLFFCLFSTC
jgi:hypothetical protein